MDAIDGLAELKANAKLEIAPHVCGGSAALWPDSNGNVVRCQKCMVFGMVMNNSESAIHEWNRYELETRRIRGEQGK